VKKLGPDAFNEPLPIEVLTRAIQKRKAPLKAILLDQGLMSGIGNWIADEVLYHARINPGRLGTSISDNEAKRLYDAIAYVLDLAVTVEADYTRFPENWLFHHRWGGAKGADIIEGREIQRDTVGGRTTAWVPAIQL
jgi:formamidopyrimidine-DNA glycosylase